MPRFTPERLRAILVASIALNLFLVALVGAQGWRAVQLRRMAVPVISELERLGLQDPEGTLERLGARLSRDDAAILVGAARSRLNALLSVKAEFLSAAARAREEIARDPVDPAGLRAAIAAARRQRQHFGPLLEDILLDAVPRMTPAGRQALSQLHGFAAP
ncbi:periplasmic heavy metal sensor [Falsiroseomonas selenitidurans]|uniref:Periplasmic heavy metal sensor n=1 Tax=Falsiroseomonas selenitidurans TaxID=2716335 RepID=A0ABX1E7B2_9PROT|nr:periplasmic heavy metal sensor [Falsiroseomonas selenitidurans]NKC31677.1 periplasmic heavy metal sensor [Falsiroseomonas selenitidurans]